ncbi:MAG: hypothetical protein AAF738_02695 [Bacteroidota bacterium]
MQIIIRCMGIYCLLWCSVQAMAQGPPITADKPIMLGAKSWVVKTLTEIRATDEGVFSKVPLMVHYLPSSNTLLGVHLPLVQGNFRRQDRTTRGLGDIELLAKYQFYRKDQMGKTFRLVAKTLQILPTGEDFNVEGISMGFYQTYVGIVAGYETIKYGISNEVGYHAHVGHDMHEWRYKLGFGLPLLKPTYPVNQVNLYFEYQSSWFTSTEEYLLLYAQGVQYAKGRWTIEAAVQFPLVQHITSEERQRNQSLFLGTRYIF